MGEPQAAIKSVTTRRRMPPSSHAAARPRKSAGAVPVDLEAERPEVLADGAPREELLAQAVLAVVEHGALVAAAADARHVELARAEIHRDARAARVAAGVLRRARDLRAERNA